MSFIDFLFGGSAPTPGSSTSSTEVQLPEWYTEYTKNMLGRAQGAAELPYFQYTGPRIAGFTPTEKTGFEMTKAAAGSYQPFLGQAGEALAGASKTFPSAVQEYMNPYTQNVVDQIAAQGVRQLQEKYLPAIGQEFIQAGQFGVGPGSTRMGEFGARALRDVQQAVLGEQAKALQAGYGQAADIFQSDAARKAQLAGTAADIAGMAQKYGLTGAGAVAGVGAKEREMSQANLNLAYEDFLKQEGYPKEQIKFLADVLSGIRLPQTTISKETGTPAQPGEPSLISKFISGGKGAADLIGMISKYFTSNSGSGDDFDYKAFDDWLKKQMSSSSGPETGGGKPAPKVDEEVSGTVNPSG
jgi:hypothetical protein